MSRKTSGSRIMSRTLLRPTVSARIRRRTRTRGDHARRTGSSHRCPRASIRLWSSSSRNAWRYTATWNTCVVSDAGARARKHSSRGPNLRSKTCGVSTKRRRLNEQDEATELVGLCLWDILSDNHDVIEPDGRLADIGSFRGAGWLPETPRVCRRAVSVSYSTATKHSATSPDRSGNQCTES